MLFGEFDSVRGTDVAAVVNGAWSYSSGATKQWQKLNAKLRPSFAGAVAADFDGNGRTDIAFDDGGTWRYSPDGSGPLKLLRPNQGPSRPLKGLLVGNFEGTGKASIVRYGPDDRNRFGIWRGLGSDVDFKQLSEQNMR